MAEFERITDACICDLKQPAFKTVVCLTFNTDNFKISACNRFAIIEGKVNCTLLSSIFLEWSLDIQEENFAVNKLG